MPAQEQFQRKLRIDHCGTFQSSAIDEQHRAPQTESRLTNKGFEPEAVS
jgi:hypothetical protein